VGATRSGVPAGYTVDHHRIRLGEGPAVFARAHACLRDWRMFDLGWVGLSGTVPRIQPGTTVAILVHAYGLWSVHACRIVYVVDARTPTGKSGVSLRDVHPAELGATAARAAMERAGIEPQEIDEVLIGHARQAGSGPNPARQVGHRAGVPNAAPAQTINKA